MQCEHCKKRKATVFYKENMGGRIKEYQLCTPCAAEMQKTGELEDMSVLMESFISPFSWGDGEGGVFPWTIHATSAPAPMNTKTCPSCGMTAEGIRRSGRFGCGACYTYFSDELSGLLRGIHGSASHVGRAPHTHRRRKERQDRIRELKARLTEAIAAEAYEQAALLRDEIKSLEGDL